MSEWKKDEIGYVKAEFVNQIKNGDDSLKFRVGDGSVVYLRPEEVFHSIPPSQPAPVDVSAIRVGDEVTVRATVLDVNGCQVRVLVDGEDPEAWWWFENSTIASHTPAPRPPTLAEFEALPLEVRERLFAEMVKGGAK